MKFDLCVIGTQDTTIKLIEHLKEIGHYVDCIITIDRSYVNIESISGFSSVASYAEKNDITVYKTVDYSLRDVKSEEFFTENTFGIGICMGWQRLIPQYVLDSFEFGIFGFHGSCGYLPYGRGRSPLNWSIINGDKRFILNMFQYDEKADSPNVYHNAMFEINEHDTIRTLQYKNLLVSFELSRKLIDDYRNRTISIHSDSRDIDMLYPKRSAKDGLVDFKKLKTREIYNLVRGVTRPFPGAFSYLKEKDTSVRIWKAHPFDNILDFSKYQPGEVIDIFDDNLVIRTIDGSILVTEYECEMIICKGDVFIAKM